MGVQKQAHVQTMKIIAIGWNYPKHTKELEQPVPTEPTVFCKPDSALLKDGKTMYIPDFTQQLDYECELVVRIDRLGKGIAAKFAHRYYNEVALGIDFTARDLQRKFQAEGKPWELCKGFDGSAILSNFVPLTEIGGDIQNLHFELRRNGETVQDGFSGDMLFTVDHIIEFVSRYFTLKTGDLIYTGTPAGVGPVNRGDRLQGYLEGRKMLDFDIK